MTLSALTKEKNNLIGGSADLAGSNNTKTKNHKIIKLPRFYWRLHSLRSERTRNEWGYEWYCTSQQSNSLWRYFFDIF